MVAIFAPSQGSCSFLQARCTRQLPRSSEQGLTDMPPSTLAAILLVAVLFGCALYWSLRPPAPSLTTQEDEIDPLSETPVS
ncbi:hypothetical protein ACP_2234 [Acidobacterium capsulatum ATCC 51196]|uniref:Uncharacterized protein n=1 Tax=Acidobacterium capsulatum (strain ATCC 51196 / DSM 11244 / BCRC 80197 / JCM 7670 / NBRC 15755 / NCIMB 13165 / 161) TaxID=240015 RepID=C1F9S3_ACIC5|nr:hypothetical protein ACP_2234 [Acidobacterium capsulatum ATCC 51196]